MSSHALAEKKLLRIVSTAEDLSFNTGRTRHFGVKTRDDLIGHAPLTVTSQMT